MMFTFPSEGGGVDRAGIIFYHTAIILKDGRYAFAMAGDWQPGLQRRPLRKQKGPPCGGPF